MLENIIFWGSYALAWGYLALFFQADIMFFALMGFTHFGIGVAFDIFSTYLYGREYGVERLLQREENPVVVSEIRMNGLAKGLVSSYWHREYLTAALWFLYGGQA